MKKNRFSIRLKPRFFDLDVYRHVNNAAYLTFLEEARAAYCQELDLFFRPGSGIGFVIARAELEFKAPVGFGEELEIFIHSRNWARHRFEFAYRLESLTKERLVMKAKTVCVCYDLQADKAAPLPQRERRIMETYEEVEGG